MSDEQKVFTLKQVVQSIRKTIEERYQSTYWVKAEMHKLNRYPSGHCFPELLQKEDGKIVAQITGSIWKHNFDRINQRFIEVVKEPLKDDSTLLMQVKVVFHETYGLSLQILDVDPNYALGELQRERMETLRKLKETGVLNANQQLDFPLLPKRIALISAESSKGLSDFYEVLQSDPRYKIFTLLFPAYLQGDQAAGSIMQQLERIRKVAHHFDAVAIVRGGGGEVGMSCYNHYALCHAIATFPLPVLTGIGHSTNYTVAEMIAFRNAITPTKLAEFLLSSFREFDQGIAKLSGTLQNNAKTLIERKKNHLIRTVDLLNTCTKRLIVLKKTELRNMSSETRYKAKNRIQLEQTYVNKQTMKLDSGAQLVLVRHTNTLSAVRNQLIQSAHNRLRIAQSLVELSENKLRLIDPINVLRRGYSITTINGKLPTNYDDIKEGDELTTRTANFMLLSTLINKKKSDE